MAVELGLNWGELSLDAIASSRYVGKGLQSPQAPQGPRVPPIEDATVSKNRQSQELITRTPHRVSQHTGHQVITAANGNGPGQFELQPP